MSHDFSSRVKGPERTMHQLTSQDVPEIESWLETLFQCRQLDEDNVKRLCDKVRWGLRVRRQLKLVPSFVVCRPVKFSFTSRTCSQCSVP